MASAQNGYSPKAPNGYTHERSESPVTRAAAHRLRTPDGGPDPGRGETVERLGKGDPEPPAHAAVIIVTATTRAVHVP